MTEPRLTVDDQQRAARRDSLRNLLDRLQRMGLTETEAHLLRQHVEAETRDADTARAVARSNLRHVRTIVPELERAEAAIARVREFLGRHVHRVAVAPIDVLAVLNGRDPSATRAPDSPPIVGIAPPLDAADDHAGYTAPDPPIGCITLTAAPTHDPTQEPTP